METKLLKLAVERLTEDVEQLKVEMKWLKNLFISKLKKMESFSGSGENLPPEDKLLDLMQVRKVLNVSRNSVLTMVKEGRLRAVRINQRTIRYSRSEVQALIKE